MTQPILITGAARSGTSMVAGLVAATGAFGGATSGPNRNNQKGMFENAHIRNTIVKPFLKSIGCDPMGQHPLPDRDNLPDVSDVFREQITGVMRIQGYRGGPWYYKGAKMCLLWPIFHKAFPDAKWIIVRRLPDLIVDSCIRTPFMRAHKGRDGWANWVHEHVKSFEEMRAAGLNIQTIWSDRLVAGDHSEIKYAFAAHGMEISKQTIREFVDPSLYHQAQVTA